jgi:hypothetical protein
MKHPKRWEFSGTKYLTSLTVLARIEKQSLDPKKMASGSIHSFGMGYQEVFGVEG